MRKTADKIKGYLQARPHAWVTDGAYHLASLKHAPDMADVIWEVKRAMEIGIGPEMSMHGSHGTFFLKDCEGRPIAIFKLNQCCQEVIAYRLDHHHFAGVPQTVFTTLEHPFLEGKKTGSCQLFVKESVAAVEVDRRLVTHFSALSLRRIATLDIRTMNQDRHTSNLLVVGNKEIIPIDHGFILAHDLGEIHMSWIEWPQAATPFTETERAYLSLLDPEQDRRMLIDEFFVEEFLANRVFVATILLKLAAIRGFTAATLALIMTRRHRMSDECSHFERLIGMIKERNPPNWTIFSRTVYEEVEKFLDVYEKISQPAYQSVDR